MSDHGPIKNWAVEGVDVIAAYLDVSLAEAERMCASREIEAFRTTDGRWAIIKKKLAEYIQQRDAGGGR
ncbi:hypothetical protein ASG32_23125 [Methylobacterium sp. Leaf361]|uniref:helix-turn-helix domain-containing protein n=1 Tax=Methylobacterium sp. Leaf361 TaxID=1736352 RepID=UPI0006F47862|nr:helix-turn-helix domain-containing protein [Methylobacterium sp. Leaf361]KQS82462.1 hypothetical protein ASG32_23125 [Methylobacterium sp. Leaf361]